MEIRIGSMSLTGVLTEGPGDLRIQPKSELDINPNVNAPGVDLIDNGNDQYTITVSVQRQQKTPEAAAYFLLSHTKLVRAVGVALCTYKTDSGTMYFYPAFAQVTDMTLEGCRTFHTYRVITGAMYDTPPAK